MIPSCSYTIFLNLVLQDGGVLTFGAGTYGQLGHGTAQSEKVPRKVFELMGSEVTMIACGRLDSMSCIGIWLIFVHTLWEFVFTLLL